MKPAVILLALLPICEVHAVETPGYKIHSAIYGAGAATIDVTEKIQEHIRSGKVNIVVRPAELGPDPKPYINKQLMVTFDRDGQRKVRTWGENSTVSLPELSLSSKAAPLAVTGRTFRTLDEILTVIPADVDLKQGTKWNGAAAQIANEALKEKAVGQLLEATITVHRIEQERSATYGTDVRGSTHELTLRFNGATVNVSCFIYFRKEATEALAKVKFPQKVVITGKIARAEFTKAGQWINFEFVDARMK